MWNLVGMKLNQLLNVMCNLVNMSQRNQGLCAFGDLSSYYSCNAFLCVCGGGSMWGIARVSVFERERERERDREQNVIFC